MRSATTYGSVVAVTNANARRRPLLHHAAPDHERLADGAPSPPRRDDGAVTSPRASGIVGAMVGSFSRRLLAVLQLTRSALVFTAIGDAWAGLLLRYGSSGEGLARLDVRSAVGMTMVSVGLYGFGMSLNDVIDRRRDATVAADRPLPSGRLPVSVGKLICVLLLALAGAGGAMLAREQPSPRLATITLALVVGVALLIVGYDFAGKYLLSLGLLTLGLIRFFHAAVADPTLSVPWHPLLLLNHVTILSTLAYAWEEKRPLLTRRHVAVVAAGLLAIDTTLLGVLCERRVGSWATLADDLSITPALLWPAAAVAGFAVAAAIVRRRHVESRGAGKVLMLVGLLWLIVYDAAFVAGHVGMVAALAVLALLPIAWVGVKVIRAWSTLVALSERPSYLRA